MWSTFKELIRQLGTSEEAKGQALLSGPLSLGSLCRREPLKAYELGDDMLRTVQWAQDGWERRHSGKRPVPDSRASHHRLSPEETEFSGGGCSEGTEALIQWELVGNRVQLLLTGLFGRWMIKSLGCLYFFQASGERKLVRFRLY